MIHKPHFFIITGGPGVGKTTLLAELQQHGLRCVPEIARQIIQEQVKTGGDALPWENIPAYTRLMLSRSVDSYLENVAHEEITLFDRGIPDTLAYSLLTRQTPSPELQQAVLTYRYNTRVFILPPWFEIYQTDTERKQTYQEAIDTYEIMYHTYQNLGYHLTIVPKLPPTQRADFMLNVLER